MNQPSNVCRYCYCINKPAINDENSTPIHTDCFDKLLTDLIEAHEQNIQLNKKILEIYDITRQHMVDTVENKPTEQF